MSTPDAIRPLAAHDLRTNPALIRAVLADVAASNVHRAARAHGFHPKTVYRWQRKRLADPSWPTDADIDMWERLRDERGTSRRRKAAQRRDYLKRRYVARGPMLIDSLGTTRRLRALYAIGWTSSQLAPRLGFSAARLSHLVSGVRPKIHRATAARVAAVYNELSMTVPQDPANLPPRHIRVHDRQRKQSAAKGWAPPLAWDDIDDPDEHPAGWQYVPATRAEILADLNDRGAGISEACRLVKLSRKSLQKWCGTHGLSDVYRALAARELTTANQYTDNEEAEVA